MKTAHYTFTTWNDSVMAAGLDSGLDKSRQSALVRRSGGTVRAQAEDKIVDLTEWRAANLDGLREEPDGTDWESGELDWEDEEPEPPSPAPRPRKSRRAMVTAELVSTLCVVAVAAVLIVRILTF